MEKQDTKGITVAKQESMADWYGQVVIKAELADYAPIRGFMVIRPRGYALWESIQDFVNKRIKAMGVQNAYFPLLIPERFFQMEAEHAEGFAPEVAWIEQQEGDRERYAIRPTSETIMYDSYSKWIRSWRDLPLRINQWCSVVRWEVKDTKIFLRSREFLWQEGHCVYETQQECLDETKMYQELYAQVAEELLAIPVILGKKTQSETFPGADSSYTIEGFMPDGKALQMGTSHLLGQGFAKAFGISFLGKSGENEIPWQNSWGITTRLLGSMVLVHGDNKGLIIPPAMAERKIAIVPILMKDESMNEKILERARAIEKDLKRYGPILDDREGYNPGWKFNDHELKGVPLRLEIGPKDVEKDQAVLVRRDTGEKSFVGVAGLHEEVKRLLDDVQQSLYLRAKKYLDESIVRISDWDGFVRADKNRKFILAPHCGSETCEESIKDETEGVTARCIPLKGGKPESGAVCVKCGNAAEYMVYFARAY